MINTSHTSRSTLDRLSTLNCGCLTHDPCHGNKQLHSSTTHVSIGGRYIAQYFETKWLLSLHCVREYKYARTLISMVFFCNWCSAADSSFFSSSTISSSLFFDSLCSCGKNTYIIFDKCIGQTKMKEIVIHGLCLTIL